MFRLPYLIKWCNILNTAPPHPPPHPPTHMLGWNVINRRLSHMSTSTPWARSKYEYPKRLIAQYFGLTHYWVLVTLHDWYWCQLSSKLYARDPWGQHSISKCFSAVVVWHRRQHIVQFFHPSNVCLKMGYWIVPAKYQIILWSWIVLAKYQIIWKNYLIFCWDNTGSPLQANVWLLTAASPYVLSWISNVYTDDASHTKAPSVKLEQYQ